MTIDEAGIREAAQRAAEEYLVSRTIPQHPAYSFEGRWLVTYDWMQITRESLQRQIDALQRQVDDLQRLWE